MTTKKFLLPVKLYVLASVEAESLEDARKLINYDSLADSMRNGDTELVTWDFKGKSYMENSPAWIDGIIPDGDVE